MYGSFLAYLAVEMEAGAFLSLGPLFTDPDLSHWGSPYTAMGGYYHCGENPTPDLPTCPGLGLPTLGGKAADTPLKRLLACMTRIKILKP